MKRKLIFLICLSIVAACGAATYSTSVSAPESSLSVTITLDKAARVFRMPAWAPGDYRIVNFGTRLTEVRFTNAGKPVASERESDPNLWLIPNGADRVTYKIRSGNPGIFSENLRIRENELFINGPAVFGYFEGHKEEQQTLRLTPFPKDGSPIACSLKQLDPYTFTASDYDELIDAPIVMGETLKTLQFTALGKPHWIVAFGRNRDTNLQGFATLGATLGQESSKIFGELPYPRYLFLLDFGGPGGGLEHMNSTRIALWPGATAERTAGFLAHEYFHLFNVKRIRSKPLGPFDYTRPAVTGALWWLEGVTDYYAEILLYRTGYADRDELLETLASEFRSLQRNPARLKISADESSRRVWEANNSSGFGGLDYYQKGKLIGLCLDLAIRARSNGRHSLDDVIAALYRECKNGKPGFEENRIRELCVTFGGQELASIYDTCVLKAEELPLKELLATHGLLLSDGKITEDPNASEAAKKLRSIWPARIP